MINVESPFTLKKDQRLKGITWTYIGTQICTCKLGFCVVGIEDKFTQKLILCFSVR